MDSAPVRGGLVRLGTAFGEVCDGHDYPAPLRAALGELLAASTLLASSLKWEGSLIVQAQSSGIVKLLCAESTHALDVRGVATWDGTIAPNAALSALMPSGQVVITLDPKTADGNAGASNQLYQGIVALNPDGIAPMLEDYMLQSQQVLTKIVLKTSAHAVAGMLIQKLPGDDAATLEGFNRVLALFQTLTAEELLSLDAATLLHRLFHEETVRVLPPVPVRAYCPCTESRVVGALRLMGWPEVDSILEEFGEVEARCQFCNKRYAFDRPTLTQLFAAFGDVPAPATKQ
jgi:molecular chaperone Hsp33